MTHDELLERIAELRFNAAGPWDAVDSEWALADALRAVVELTEDVKDYWSAKYFAELIIQAIEKELN